MTGSSHGATSPKCCITLSILLLFTLRHLHWDQVRNKGHTFITKVLPAVTRKQILAEEMEGGKKHQFFSSLCAIWKIYGNVKIPRPSSGVRCSPDSKTGGEPISARRSQHCMPSCRPQREAETGNKLNKQAGKPAQTCTGPMLAIPEHQLSLGSTEKAQRRRE